MHHEHRRTRPSPQRDELVAAFLGACALGDLDHLKRLLADDVVLVSDGGAAHHAARRPVVGPTRTARLMVNLAKRIPTDVAMVPVVVNGDAGAAMFRAGEPFIVMAVSVDADKVASIHIVVNPDKLTGLKDLAPG